MAHFLPPEHVRQVNKLEWPYLYMKMTKHCLNANMHKDQSYGPLRGICPWIMWFCYLMMNYKSQACEWTLNISFRAFLKNFPFFEFLYLFITPNSAKKYTRNTNFSIFPLGACSKIPKPKQCTPGKTLPSWCQHRNLFAPKHKILMAGLKVC